MPVWRSTDPKKDLNKEGKQRRHISAHCPLYAAVDSADRCAVDGVPNTERLQTTTVRCEHPDCWEKRVREDQGKKKRGSGGGGKAKGATTPTTPVGGAAKTLADRAKAARGGAKPAASTA